MSGAMRIDAGNATSEEVAADLLPRLDGMSEEQQVNEYRRLADLGYDMDAIQRQVEEERERQRRERIRTTPRINDRRDPDVVNTEDAEIDRIMRERGN